MGPSARKLCRLVSPLPLPNDPVRLVSPASKFPPSFTSLRDLRFVHIVQAASGKGGRLELLFVPTLLSPFATELSPFIKLIFTSSPVLIGAARGFLLNGNGSLVIASDSQDGRLFQYI